MLVAQAQLHVGRVELRTRAMARGAARMMPGADGTVTLRVITDVTSMEVFGGSGEVSLSTCFLQPTLPAAEPLLGCGGV